MKKVFFILFISGLISGASIASCWFGKNREKIEIKPQTSPLKPFERYTFENLSKTAIKPREIEVKGNLFSFEFDPTLQNKEIKKVTGQINLPAGRQVFPNKKYPVVIMLRGYVDKEIYKTGMGTKRAAEYFAKNGFITLAPDFLGYGESDPEAENIFEARFQTYTTALSLIKSLNSIDLWDQKNIFLWGHSNGGQIALAVLEITGKNYPTILWAPVSKSFPYSILYYTEELNDKGKYLRRELAKFEELYDTNLYSIHHYFNRIKSPIQIHQGLADELVLPTWSRELKQKLENLGIEISYFEYPEANHNLVPGWNTAIAKSLTFFQKHTR